MIKHQEKKDEKNSTKDLTSNLQNCQSHEKKKTGKNCETVTDYWKVRGYNPCGILDGIPDQKKEEMKN